MTKYDDICSEVDLHVRTSARQFVPRLYEALREEGLEPNDARGKIEKDFFRIWSKHTIADNLPNEAKDMSQSRRGNENAVKQVMDTEGDIVDEREMIEVPKVEFDALKQKLSEYSVADAGKLVQEIHVPFGDGLADLQARVVAAVEAEEGIFIKHQQNKYIGVRRGKN